jgi:hypothetical protein
MKRPARRLALIAATASPLLTFIPFVHPAAAATSPLRVFAVGDSYASGEGAKGPGNWINASCHQSALAAPRNAAGQLSALRPVSFTSLACSGATTGSGLGSGAGAPSPAQSLLGPGGQLAAVGFAGERIDALSISIGGNDIGFSGIVTNCMVPFNDCSLDPTVTGPLAAALASNSLPARLDAVTAAIQGPGKTVPGAVQNVFVTAYPDPTTGVFGVRCGFYPAIPFEGFDGVSVSEATFASASVVAPLNAALAAWVGRANAAPGSHPVWHFVGGTVAPFATHGYCTGGGTPLPFVDPFFWATIANPRFIATPVDSLTSQGDVMGTAHPNDLGQQAIANALFSDERFLADPLSVLVTTPTAPVIGSSTTVTVNARTSRNTAAVGASVFIDGAFRGITNQAGDLVIPGVVFNSIGGHTVTVDLNPYPMATRTIQVQGLSYTVTASPNPIPVNRLISLSLAARDSAGALVPGTFTAVGANTVTVASGATATVTIKPKYTSYYDADFGGLVREMVCPTLTFTPAAGSPFSARDVSDLMDC